MIRKILTMCVLLLLVAGVQASNLDGHFFKSLKKQVVMVSDVENYFSEWFSLPAETEWREVSRKTDRLGMERIEFRQYVAGVEVEHSQVLIHAKDGRVQTANGTVMEKKQTPAKLRKAQMVYKNGTPTDLYGRMLYLVDTPTGYRYAVKVLTADRRYWVYYDAENGTELKRITTVRHIAADDDVTSTATAHSLYNGDVTLDVMKTPSGATYLYDKERNIETRIGAFLPTMEQLGTQGNIYEYYPQGNMPDDFFQATEEQFREWNNMINQGLLTGEMAPYLRKMITDYAPFVQSPNDHYQAYRIKNLTLDKVMIPDETGTLKEFQPTAEDPTVASLEILYSGDPTKTNYGAIESFLKGWRSMPFSEPLDKRIEMLPREGVTFVFKIYDISYEAAQEIDIRYIEQYAKEISRLYFIPNANESHAVLENEKMRISFDYEPCGDPVADIHWGMARTLDYYKEKFNRNSYDDQGSTVYNLVYLPSGGNRLIDSDRNNACAFAMDPYPMVYGLGGFEGSDYYLNPVVELSVMSHEFTHIITDATAQLVYEGESGALNESFSDLIGVSVKKYVYGNDATWTIAEGAMVNYSNMRDMAHPELSEDGYDPLPGFYKGNHWVDTESPRDNGGVHTNSGVQNRWYYLLTDGEEGVDEKGIPYNITGIGINKSEQIAYRTLTEYATQQSQYADIRLASLQAAEDLYGENSLEVQTVAAAWNAVGVYEDDDNPTGISTIHNSQCIMHNEYFDLQGRKVAQPTHGLYIVNGRKVVIR